MALTRVEGIELTFIAGSSRKYYRAYAANGVGGWTHWGRIGSAGQIRQVGNIPAREKVYEKKGEGYQVRVDWMPFEVDMAQVQQDPQVLARAFQAAKKGRPVATAEQEQDAADAADDERKAREMANELLALRGLINGTPEDDSIEAKLGAALRKARGG